MLWSVAYVCTAIYAGLCLALFLLQSRLVYYPTSDMLVTPATIGLPYEDLYLHTESGSRINTWFIAAEADAITVLFFHGNAGNISHRLETIRLLNRLGANVMIFDYSGYGLSDGKPSEHQTYLDASAVWRHLLDEKGIASDRIVLFGRSLGAGVATWLAATEQPAALIVESSFTSVPDMAAKLYPMFPVRALSRIRYDNATRIAGLSIPVMVIHSPDDEVIPFEHGEALHRRAREPKTFLQIEGGHNGGFMETGARYTDGIGTFLAALQPG